MGKRNVVTAVAEIKFLEVTRVLQVAIQQITLLVTDFARQRRLFKPSLVAFDNVSGKRCIPVIVGSVIETDIAQIESLLLVTTELRRQKAGFTATLERSDNHRKNRHRHIGNVQHHRPCGNRLLGLDHHATAIEVEVLVRRIVTSTEVATGNLDSRVRQAANFHTVQLLVILECSSVINFTNFGLEVVLEAHPRQRRVLRFAENRIAGSRKDLVFLVHPDRIRLKRCGTVLELCRLIQIKSRSFNIVDQVYSMILNRIDTRRIVHPIDLSRIFYRLFTLFEFKAGHLLAIGARSEDHSDKNRENGPQKAMGFG